MKKSVKLVMIIVLLMAGGCATQKKEENTRIIDTSMFLYKVSDQKGGYSYLFGTFHPGRYPIKSLDKVTEKALDESDSIYLECDMKPSPKETEEITKYNTYNSIRDLGLEDKYENLMKQYKSLKEKNDALYNAVIALADNPSNSAFETACDAWITAREPWEKSEAFLFGPVDEMGLDPNMDSWPLDQNAIVQILNSQSWSDLEWSEGDDEAAVESAQNVRGFHTLEFLLYKNGEPRKVQ